MGIMGNMPTDPKPRFWPNNEPLKRPVDCDACKKVLYETDGRGVHVPPGQLMTTRPITLRCGDYQAMACSRACAVAWLESLDEAILYSGGYPLW
jgi:hypothetical protein